MNSPETPTQSLGHTSAKPSTRTRRPQDEEIEDFKPRYVELPRHRRARTGVRNIQLGIVALILSAILGTAALLIRGTGAFIPLAICLGTFTVLWILARLRLFHQRNGVFLGLTLVCVFGLSIPLIQAGYRAIDQTIRNSQQAAAMIAAQQPAPSNGATTSAPANAPAVSTEPAQPAEAPLLVDALQLPPPDLSTGKHIRVTHDEDVAIGRKTYRVIKGDVFPLEDIRDGQAIFSAKGMRLPLPADSVEIVTPPRSPAKATTAGRPPSPAVSDQELPAEVTQRAQAEAVRRYPALGVQGSPENTLFVNAYKQFKTERPEFFNEAEWPLFLAEGLARENGWKRADGVPTPPPASPDLDADPGATPGPNSGPGPDAGEPGPAMDTAQPELPPAPSAGVAPPEPVETPLEPKQ